MLEIPVKFQNLPFFGRNFTFFHFRVFFFLKISHPYCVQVQGTYRVDGDTITGCVHGLSLERTSEKSREEEERVVAHVYIIEYVLGDQRDCGNST